MSLMHQVTQLLSAIESGDPKASEELLPRVYNELRKLASAKVAQEMPGHTLQPTALVHEAWLRLVGDDNQQWNSRGHFFAAAAEAMRRILVENARRKRREKHGGHSRKVDLSELDIAIHIDDDRLLMVNEALDTSQTIDPTRAQLIKLRFFVGLSNVKAAKMLGIPERMAKRNWAYASAWLFEELKNRSNPLKSIFTNLAQMYPPRRTDHCTVEAPLYQAL